MQHPNISHSIDFCFRLPYPASQIYPSRTGYRYDICADEGTSDLLGRLLRDSTLKGSFLWISLDTALTSDLAAQVGWCNWQLTAKRTANITEKPLDNAKQSSASEPFHIRLSLLDPNMWASFKAQARSSNLKTRHCLGPLAQVNKAFLRWLPACMQLRILLYCMLWAVSSA